jgi:hypothetical protein
MIECFGTPEWYMTNAQWREWMKDKPRLGEVSVARAFTVGITKDGSVAVTDGCDECFSAIMEPDEMRALAKELLAVADEAEKVNP